MVANQQFGSCLLDVEYHHSVLQSFVMRPLSREIVDALKLTRMRQHNGVFCEKDAVECKRELLFHYVFVSENYLMFLEANNFAFNVNCFLSMRYWYSHVNRLFIIELSELLQPFCHVMVYGAFTLTGQNLDFETFEQSLNICIE